MPTDSDRPHSEAERIYADALYSIETGGELDIEELCQAHPEHAEELHELHLARQRIEGLMARDWSPASLSERIKAKYGDDADPGVTLDKETKEPGDDFSSEVLRRLGERHGAFGRYKIQGEVARGGQGAVLRIWDEDLRRNLAMKVILGQGEAQAGDTPQVDSKTLGRFLEEAQVTGQLEHPGIVPVHELGLDSEGRIYFTMKLVKGQTLKEIFDLVHAGEEGWTVTRALGVMLKVCEAMSYAHSKGVIHRDLKPGNIMVGRFGEVYVMDWGLARVLGEEDRKDIRIQPEMKTEAFRSERRDRADETPDSPLVTMDGDVVGTPAYMSPEQARGDLDQLGPQSDVYAVGAMLYHLLSGQMPYVPPGAKANAYAVWRWVMEGPPKPVLEIANDVPAELEAICEKMMARKVADRYADMEGLAGDLRAFLEGRVVQAHETGAWAETRKWVRRNKPLAASLAAVVLALVAGMVASWLLKERAAENLSLAETRGRETEVALAESEKQRYVANVQMASVWLDLGQPWRARERLDDCPRDHRMNWEWHWLDARQDSSLLAITDRSEGSVFATFSPDGSRILTASVRGNARLWDAATGKGLVRFDHVPPLRVGTALGPDGSQLATLVPGEMSVHVTDAMTGETAILLTGHERFPFSMDFAPDGKHIVTASPDQTARVWDVTTGREVAVLDHQAWVLHAFFSPDGTMIATYTNEPTVHIWQANTGQHVVEFRGSIGRHSAEFSFCPDSTRLVMVSEDANTILIHHLATGQSTAIPCGRAESPAFSPDGRLVAAGSEDSVVRVWDAATGQIVHELAGHTSRVFRAVFSPDGRLLVTASDDGTARIWDARAGLPKGEPLQSS